jgi:hypothetical protein
VLSILAERGYHYDSSIFPTWFLWLFMVYGKVFVKHADYNLGPVVNPLAPKRPYWPRAERVHREQTAGGRPDQGSQDQRPGKGNPDGSAASGFFQHVLASLRCLTSQASAGAGTGTTATWACGPCPTAEVRRL